MTFERWFEGALGAPFPFPLPLPLVRTGDSTHFASAPSPELSASALMLPTFPTSIEHYLAAGQWGYGMANHAFYYVWRDARASAEGTGEHRCFFRLPFGGAYGGDDEAAEIVRFLRGYAEWNERNFANLVSSELVWSMGSASAKLTFDAESGQRKSLEDDGQKLPRKENGALLPASTWWSYLDERIAAQR